MGEGFPQAKACLSQLTPWSNGRTTGFHPVCMGSNPIGVTCKPSNSLQNQRPKGVINTPIDIKEAAKKAQQRKDIYPKIKFGEKGDEEGSLILRFDQPTFDQAVNPKPFPGQSGEFLTILGTVMENSDFGHAKGYQGTVSGAPGTTLGDGLLKVYSNHPNGLLGVVVRIDAYNYPNKNMANKLTRAYRVSELVGYKSA